MLKRCLAVAALLLVAAAPLGAELKFTTRLQVRDAAAPPPVDPTLTVLGTRLIDAMLPGGSLETVTLIGDRGVRVEWNKALPGIPAGAILLGRPDGSVVMINPAEKTYWRMSAAAVKGTVGGPEPTVTTKKTGQTSDVLGVPCERVTYEMRLPMPAQPNTQLPAGAPAELMLSGESCIAGQYKRYAALMARVPGLTSLGGEKLAEDGLVLTQITRSPMFGAREMESKVTAIAEESAPASLFEIPAGYKEVPAPGIGR